MRKITSRNEAKHEPQSHHDQTNEIHDRKSLERGCRVWLKTRGYPKEERAVARSKEEAMKG
jgi:hypothetical protein